MHAGCKKHEFQTIYQTLSYSEEGLQKRKTVKCNILSYLWFPMSQCFSSFSSWSSGIDSKCSLNPIWTGGGWNLPPLRFFLHNSKTPLDIEKKLSDFNFTPLMDILHILAITIVVRCCHSNLLFPVCHVIFWVEKTKKVELFSR